MKHLKHKKYFINRSSRSQREQELLHDLLEDVWRLGQDENAAAYAEHYKRLLSQKELIDQQYLRQPTVRQTIELVKCLKENNRETIRDIKDAIRASNPTWIPDVRYDEALTKAVDFAIRLSLFTRPILVNNGLTLQECLFQSLKSMSDSCIAPATGCLPSNFCANVLMRTGGMTIVATSILQEHLTFETRKRLLVFGHASALRRLNEISSEERLLFPGDLLHETEMTLRLLFRPNEIVSAKRKKRLARKARADLELGFGEEAPFDLELYPIWGHRLAKIQRRYDATVPEAAIQWWYDDRQKREWATFWVAIVVFALTVFFGLTSTAIGIMQVYAAFRALPRGNLSAASGG